MQPYMDRSESQLVQFDLLTGFTAVYIVTHQEYTRLDWLRENHERSHIKSRQVC